MAEHGEWVFASHEITVDAPYQIVSGRLADLAHWGSLDSLSAAVYEGGLETVVRVGPFGATRGLSKLVRLQALDPVRRGDTTTVSLRWEATGAAGDLFPVLDADLIVTPDGADRSRLKLVGSYRPPLGKAGAVLDRAIMGRVADATIRSLLERVAAAVADPAPDPQANTDAAPWWRPIARPDES